MASKGGGSFKAAKSGVSNQEPRVSTDSKQPGCPTAGRPWIGQRQAEVKLCNKGKKMGKDHKTLIRFSKVHTCRILPWLSRFYAGRHQLGDALVPRSSQSDDTAKCAAGGCLLSTFFNVFLAVTQYPAPFNLTGRFVRWKAVWHVHLSLPFWNWSDFWGGIPHWKWRAVQVGSISGINGYYLCMKYILNKFVYIYTSIDHTYNTHAIDSYFTNIAYITHTMTIHMHHMHHMHHMLEYLSGRWFGALQLLSVGPGTLYSWLVHQLPFWSY